MAVKCRIKYTATSVRAEYEPGCANFSYWLYLKVDSSRWKQTGEGIWLWSEVSDEEAEYIEKLAIAQWGPEGCEVIGRPVKPEKIIPAPVKDREVTTEQLGLFVC